MTAKDNIFKIIKAIIDIVKTQKWKMKKVKTVWNYFVDDNNKSTALTTFLNALQILIHLILTTTMLYCIMLLLLLLSLQLCLTLCDPIDGSPPGSPIPGTLQARILEWVAISFSNTWKWKLKVKSLSCVQLLATPWTAVYQVPLSMEFSRQEYWSRLPLPSPLHYEVLWFYHFIGEKTGAQRG